MNRHSDICVCSVVQCQMKDRQSTTLRRCLALHTPTRPRFNLSGMSSMVQPAAAPLISSLATCEGVGQAGLVIGLLGQTVSGFSSIEKLDTGINPLMVQ